MVTCGKLKKDTCEGPSCFWVMGKGCRSKKASNNEDKPKKVVDIKDKERKVEKVVNEDKNRVKMAKVVVVKMDDIKRPKVEKERERGEGKKQKKVAKPPVTRYLFGQVVVFTGFRNAILKESIERLGGEVISKPSNRTTLVIAKDIMRNSASIRFARQNKVKLVSLENFVRACPSARA